MLVPGLPIVLIVAIAAPVSAAQVLFGKKLLLRNPPAGPTKNKVVHLAKDADVAVGTAGGPGDPQCSGAGGGGGSLRITASGGAGDVTIALPCGGWTTNTANTLYQYQDSTGASCQRVLVRGGALAKAICKGSQLAIDVGAGMAPITVVTTLNQEEYVTQWAGDIVADGSDEIKFLAKNAPAVTLPCSCGVTDPTTLTITAAAGVGSCGTRTNANGTSFGQMNCGDLFLGGGQPQPVLPTALPTPLSAVLDVATCSGGTLTLGPTTSAETGSNRTCTSAGCLFGHAVPLPYVSGVDLSLCIVPTVSGTASGTADCGTGVTSIVLPLEVATYFTQSASAPCPICSGGTCVGGETNGMACTTSDDCGPPDDVTFVGSFTLPLALQTGAATWTATPATNDTGVELDQARVFCGYCRDEDGTQAFQSPAQACWRNGQPVGAACAQPFETCEQRNEGAFGPNGGNVQTISVTGTTPGSLADHAAHAATLAGLFCLPPNASTPGGTFDLPGPGALTMNGTIQVQ